MLGKWQCYWGVGMDMMAAVKIENVIMTEVLRWWKQRKELIF